MEHKKNTVILLVCLLALLVSALLSLGLGAVSISIPQILAGLRQGGESVESRILLHIRIPRLIASILAGAALAVCGAVLQTVLANPLASPGIIGVNAGAGLAQVLFLVLLPGMMPLLPFASFLGALGTVLLVYGIARRAGASRITLILSGVAISSLMTAGINTLTTLFPDLLSDMHDFQTGGFSHVSLSTLLPAGLVIVIGIFAALFLSGELELLSLGESTALSLGLNVRLYRFGFLVLAAALSGAAVSFGGLISFVGLIVPHMARLLLRGGSRRLLIAACALIGATFLVLCDTAARTLFAPFELPVGILIAYLGVPFFLWLLFGERRKRHD